MVGTPDTKMSGRIIKPNRLKAGDTLGIVANSTPISCSSPETIDLAYRRLREYGFNIIEAPNCRLKHGHTAGSIAERVDALHSFFFDPNIAGILNFWGGYQSHQLVEYLDYEAIRDHPKLFIGFSDSTPIQLALFSKAGLVSVSGPAAVTFGKPSLPAFTWNHFKALVMEPSPSFVLAASKEFADNRWYETPDKLMQFEKTPPWKAYRQGAAEGFLVGGNLGAMLLLAATEYWPDLTATILFLEEDDVETPCTIDRMYTQLRQMGVFDQIAGLIIGRFSRAVRFAANDSFEMILDNALSGYEFPVIIGVDFGHTDPLVSLPIGVRCRIETNELRIELLEAAVQ